MHKKMLAGVGVERRPERLLLARVRGPGLERDGPSR